VVCVNTSDSIRKPTTLVFHVRIGGASRASIRIRLFDDAGTDGEVVMSARDEVLLRGLIDWVALERVHHRVARENAGEPLAVIQDKVLDLIRSLVTDGLFELAILTPQTTALARGMPRSMSPLSGSATYM
jgi:hypothetical protein